VPWKLARTEAQPRKHGPANRHNQPGPTVPHGATHGYSIEGSPSTTRTSTTPLPPVTPAWYGNAPCGKRPERPVAQGWTCPGRRVVPNVENLGRDASRNRSVRRFPVDFEATHTRRRYVPRAHTHTRSQQTNPSTNPATHAHSVQWRGGRERQARRLPRHWSWAGSSRSSHPQTQGRAPRSCPRRPRPPTRLGSGGRAPRTTSPVRGRI